jgi:predicted RNA binding protein YcfA (HicA-like mRNA interferase family)
VRILKKAGFEEMRQSGSHLILANRDTKKMIPVPMHSGDIKRGLLLGIIKQSGMTQGDFLGLR